MWYSPSRTVLAASFGGLSDLQARAEFTTWLESRRDRIRGSTDGKKGHGKGLKEERERNLRGCGGILEDILSSLSCLAIHRPLEDAA